MATIIVKDGSGASRYFLASGSGTTASPYIPHHVLDDGAGNTLGVSGSPLVVSGTLSLGAAASVIQSSPNSIGNAWPVDLTDGVDTIAIDSASRLTVVASAVVTNTVSASISNTLTAQASILNVAIDSASRLSVVASAVIPGTVSASISNTLSASVIQSTPAAFGAAWPVRLTDGVDGATIDSASRIQTVASAIITDTVSASIANTVTVAQSATPWTTRLVDGSGNAYGVSAASPLYISGAAGGTGASIILTDGVDTVTVDSASRLLTVASAVVTNQISASISNTLTAQASILNISIDSASRIQTVASAVITSQVSASISNTLTASVVQSTGAGITAPWSMRLSDGTDSAAIDSASRQLIAASAEITNRVSASISNTVTVDQASAPWGVRVIDSGGNAYGVSAASPLYITGGAAGGTSATDRAAYAEGTTSYTPMGGLYQPSPLALTASQAGAARMTAYRALHTSLRDESGNVLGVSGSPLYVTGGAAGGSSMALTDGTDTAAIDSASRLLTVASAVITNTVSASISNTLTTQASILNVSIDSASRLQTVASAIITGQVSASISNTVTVAQGASGANPWGVRVLDAAGNAYGVSAASPLYISGAAGGTGASIILTDGVDTVTVDSASRLLTVASAVVTNQISASISNTLTAQASILNVSIDSASRLQTVASAVITGQVSASISNTLTASVIQGTPAAITAPWPVRMSDGTDSAAIDSASRQLVAASAEITNTVSASIANTVTVAQGASGASPWGVRVLDAAGNAYGVSAASPIYVSGGVGGGSGASMLITDVGGDTVAIDSASRLLTAASAVVTNIVSASIANTVTTQASILNISIDSASRIQTVASAVITAQVSASISNTLTASAIQGTPAAYAAAWPMRITDGVDGAAVTTASGQHVNLRSNSGNELGVSGSPIAVAADNAIYYSGSLFTPVSLGFSGSTAGSSVVVAGVSGSQIRVLALTFTTSSSQFVGWQSGSSGTAASTIPAMDFATHGGMDVNRMPYGYLLQTGNGSALVISQTTACYVRGSLTYIVVPQ